MYYIGGRLATLIDNGTLLDAIPDTNPSSTVYDFDALDLSNTIVIMQIIAKILLDGNAFEDMLEHFQDNCDGFFLIGSFDASDYPNNPQLLSKTDVFLQYYPHEYEIGAAIVHKELKINAFCN